MTLTISADTSSLNALFDELEEELDEAVRPAAQAAAQLLYMQVKSNVDRLGRKSGNLSNSIYQAYSRDNSGPGRATYHVSWNTRKAPHGHLLENGYIQRYASYVGRDGKWYTAVRPEMQGKPKPRRRASQAEKDAYYVPRPDGPVQWVGRAFVRSAQAQFDAAMQAATEELLRRISEKT
nr:HK97 gp10 family phage protein [Pseudomonas sp.]